MERDGKNNQNGQNSRRKQANEDIARIFYDVEHPAGYGSVDNLHKAMRGTVSKNYIRKYLSAQDTYTLHRQIKRKFRRNKYYVSTIDETWQADLLDIKNMSKENENHTFLLTAIDIFSRFAFAKPLKSKSSSEVTEKFKQILNESGRCPLHLQTDKGKEFKNKVFQDFLKEKNIKFYVSNNPDTKCALIERFQRTLRGKITRYLTYKNTKTFLPVLPLLLKSYNNQIHSSTKIAPANVNQDNVLQVWRNQYQGIDFFKTTLPKFKVGQKVRISREKMIFEKKTVTTNYSEELFVIDRVIPRDPVVYKLKDLEGEEIAGTFYEDELVRVRDDGERVFKIDKILQTKKVGRSVKHLVRWLGYPPKFDSWVSDKDIQQI